MIGSEPDSTELLISIANVGSYPRPSCLLRMNAETHARDWVDVGVGQDLVTGVGIHADDQYVYHISVTVKPYVTYLSILDRAMLQVLDVHPLPEINDGHSVVRLGDEIIVVSTETDEIWAYPIKGTKIGPGRLFWTPTGSGEDVHHVNSVAIADGDLLCSAFGPKDGDSWYTARNGYIRNLTTDSILIDGLLQPHSATWHEGELYYCNSLEGSVNRGEDVVVYLAGYSRGLAFADGLMYTGTSLSRRPADASSGANLFTNPIDEGVLHGQCALVQMTEHGTNRTEVAMPPFGNEIYDILVL